MVAVLDGLVQQPVSGPPVCVKVAVLPEVGAPGNGYHTRFAILPSVPVHGCELLIGLGCESQPAISQAPVLATDPLQPLIHFCLLIFSKTDIGETVKAKPPAGRPVPVLPSIARSPVIH